MDLAQSLELERSDRNFDIQTPVIEDAVADNMSSILPPENIYDHAVTFKPQIKEQQYLLESQKKMLRVAQAGYYPKLNFGASYSNGYYHSTSGGEFADTRSFSEQFKQNGQKIVGFSLSIPLFNRFQVRNSVRTARINIINRELLMENTKKTLYKGNPASVLQRNGFPREIYGFRQIRHGEQGSVQLCPRALQRR